MLARLSLLTLTVFSLSACVPESSVVNSVSDVNDTNNDLPISSDHPKALLGSQLFFDINLSASRNLSCASCHDISKAFTDVRRTSKHRGAVSLGSDGFSVGGRNAPPVSYAALTPHFHQMANGQYRGGQFLDGRAKSLSVQAAGPFTNPVEMQMPSEDAVVDRVLENEEYLAQLKAIYGEDILSDKKQTFLSVTDAISYFEQTKLFMPFDSKYDRVQRGEDVFTPQEELGRTLFFSQQFTNCNSCHQLNASPFYERETFTNYQYRNIGVPANPELALAAPDGGLIDNPAVNNAAEKGKFRVPTLRNVAITGPYMHNGVFQDLKTVILFYDHFNNPKRKLNPETNLPWAAPEVSENIDLVTLEKAPALDARRVDALVAFLKTLTDKQYEPLLSK